MTLDEFRRGLKDPNPEVRAYLVGKLMRQAKPDDVFTFVSTREIGGFSPLTLAWILRGLQPVVLAQAAGWTAEKAAELGRFTS
jgi:hypothetical protein